MKEIGMLLLYLSFLDHRTSEFLAFVLTAGW